jgi:plastocyanin
LRRFAVVLLVALGACSSGTDVKGDVLMESDQTFAPAELTVSAGDAVVFANTSKETHTVTAYSDTLPEGGRYFASGGATSESEARDSLSEGLIDPGDTFEVTFTEPGTYAYFCIPHETSGMKGTIVVE